MTQPKSNIKVTQTLYSAFLMGQVLFLGVSIYLRQTGFGITLDESVNRILQIVALLLSVTAVLIGFKIFNKKVAAARDGSYSSGEKMAMHRAASIIQWAMTEGACLFSIVGYLLTGNWAFVGLAVALLFLFAGYYPSKNRVMMQLGLSEEEV